VKFHPHTPNESKLEQKSIIIMDEVDGMSGNADRGGIATLIDFIKKSKLPIICICNDRKHQKIKSLANYCHDLRFYKPNVKQVAGKLMTILFKEGIKNMTNPAITKIVEGCNSDIRQCLHTIEMIKASQIKGKFSNKESIYDDAKNLSNAVQKDVSLKNPFTDCQKIFECSKQEYFKNHGPDIKEKIELFFNDYMLMPNFVFENYPMSSAPFGKRSKNGFRNHLRGGWGFGFV